MRVLLAEDNSDHQRLLLLQLARANPNASVTLATNRDEVLQAARDGAYDCIVLDFNLPPHTAPEILEDLGSLQENVPRLVISSSDEQRVVIDAMRSGVVDFLAKTDAVRSGKLWERIQVAITSERAARREQRSTDRRLSALETQASTDHLTGLLNRRAVDSVLTSDRRQNDRRGVTALILADVDHFKSVNDTHGHEAGDRVLRDVARVLRSSAGEADVVARWGGEEFLIVRQSASMTDAWIWADAVRREITDTVRLAEDPEHRITASFGVDVLPSSEISADAVVRADFAMYLAKNSGRDRVCTWPMVNAMEAAHRVSRNPSLTPRARLLSLISVMRNELGPVQGDHVGPHGAFVRHLATSVGLAMLEDASVVDELSLAAEFHDIGKIGVPEDLLALPRALSEDEKRFVDEHARFGAQLLEACDAPTGAIEAVREHHDRFDDDEALAGAPTPSVILSACDAMVAMMSERPYSTPRTRVQALAELRAERGAQFHPEVVDVMHFVEHDRMLAA